MDHLIRSACGWLMLLIVLVSCEPEATPFPVEIPATATPTEEPSPLPPVRYAVPAALSEIAASFLADTNAQITTFDDTIPDRQSLGTDFDIILATGLHQDAAQAPFTHSTHLLINQALPPLDDPAVRTIIVQAISQPSDAEIINTLRTDLANAGWPDGFELRLIYAPATSTIALRDALKPFHIDLQTIPLAEATEWDIERHHLAITTNREQANASDVTEKIPLDQMSLSYWTAPDIAVTFSSEGWPIASHR
jgi:hypothetical protein